MKKILIVSLLLLFSGHIFSQITKSEAYNIVKSHLENDGNDMEVFSFPTLFPPNETIFTMDSFVVSPNNYSWFFFVNPYPHANWKHECWYVFINNLSSEYISVVNFMPPNDLSDFDVHNSVLTPFVYIADSIFNIPANNNAMTQTNTDYAVIISGGSSKKYNWPRYWFDCSAIYRTLINKYNYSKNNIYVAMANGVNSNACYNWGTEYIPLYATMPYDLDLDGVGDIQFAANASNLSQIFTTLQQRLTKNDNVFIFVTDHGGIGSTLSLWGDNVYPSWFAMQINKLSKAKTINVCMEQCYSGGYINALAGNNRVIATACAATEKSWSRNKYYDEFCYHWISAANGSTPNGSVVNADYNQDGYVSMAEAFYYANNHDTRSETPQYYSNKACLGASMDLNGVFDYSCFGYDLYTRDNRSDDGREPLFDPSDGLTDSPDIWLRNIQDGNTVHQCMVMGTNYLYVKIRNRSTSTDTSWSTDSIRIYARPTFLHGHYFNPANWTELCKAKLPRVAPGKDSTIIIPVNNQNLNVLNTQYALYSRIESPYDILSSPETNTIGRNVEYNNNISLKNVFITNMMLSQNNFGLDAIFAATSGPSSLTSSKLRFDLSSGTPNILNEAEVTMIFPEDLMIDWSPISDNLKQVTANTFLVTGETVEISGVPETDVTLRYNFLTRRNEPEEIYKNHITQYVGDDEELVGGLTIQIEKPERAANEMFTANAGNDTAILIGTSATLHATQINENATYRWYDKQRNFLYEGVNYSATPTQTSEYILEVTAESDGYRDLDTVKVTVVPGCIRSISPNPVSDNWITVSYEYSTSVTSAQLLIYNTATTTLVGNYDLSNLGNVSSLDIEVTNYPTGSYTVVLVCDNAVCHSKVLIRQ